MSVRVYNAEATTRLWKCIRRNSDGIVAHYSFGYEDLPVIISALQQNADPRRSANCREHGFRPDSYDAHDLLYYLMVYSGGDNERLHQAVTLAVEQGSNLNDLSYGGGRRSILHYVQGRAQDGLAAFLVEKGADPNAVNDDGETPLFIQHSQPGNVLARAQAGTILALIRAGTDIAKCRNDGQSAPQIWNDKIHFWLTNLPELRQEYPKELLAIFPYIERRNPPIWEAWNLFYPLLLRDGKLARPDECATVQYLRGAVLEREK